MCGTDNNDSTLFVSLLSYDFLLLELKVILNNMDIGFIIDKNSMSKILVPASSHDFSNDKRLLIPFTSGEKLGFLNQKLEIVVPAIYSMYYRECYCKDDIVIVAKRGQKHQPRAYYYGAIDYTGKEVIPSTCFQIGASNSNKKLFTIQSQDYKFSVIHLDNGEIIPSSTYTYIDSFYNGIARVKIGGDPNCIRDKGIWGVITENNEIIVPIEYNYIQPLENNRDGRIYLVYNDSHKEYIPLDALK